MKKVIPWVGAALFGLGIAVADRYLEFSSNIFPKSLERVIGDIAMEKETSHRDFDRVIKELADKKYSAAALEDSGFLAPIVETIASDQPETLFNRTIVTRSNSPFMQWFYNQISSQKSQFIKDNVDYIVFAPDITHRLGSSHGDVAGLSSGKRVIFIDTKADDGSTKNPLLYVSVMGHEAGHEHKQFNSTLASEKYAFETELSFFDDQIRTIGTRPLLEARRQTVASRIRMARFLEGFGDDFSNVYPGTHILSGDLLKAGVGVTVLDKYARSSNLKTDFDAQLFASVSIAKMVKTTKREDVIRRLYDFVTDPKNQGTFLQVTAASALQYLAPKAMLLETDADIMRGNGLYLSFGKRGKRDGVGEYLGSSSGYGIDGLPELEHLLKNEYQTSVTYQTISRKVTCSQVSDLSGYRLDDVSRVVISGDQAIIPRKEGRPDEQFVRVGYRVLRDRKGGLEEIQVLYMTNCLTLKQGDTTFNITKVDIYDANGKYVRSGLTGLAAQHVGVEMIIDSKALAKQYNTKK